jgi:arabinan endo-1,5-alpha-L-arabinosidase
MRDSDRPAERLRPVLYGDSWLVGPNPPLADLGAERPGEGSTEGLPAHQCVDHHLYQGPDGAWHLWGCIRGTPVGRILYHWEGESLDAGPWRQTGEILRVDRSAGESLDDRGGEEWIQAPFVVRDGGVYWMFYGGHGTGVDEGGQPVPYGDPRMACQMCLMTSQDGRRWTRHREGDGYSRLFLGPGETRDPCVIRIDGRWHLYYAGYHAGDPYKAGVYLRTSDDLTHWSDWRLVHQDRRYGDGPWDTECPHIVYRGGAYYLFRTEEYASAKTHVFRSEDPHDFGIGDASAHYVGSIAVAAPEIIVDRDGGEYITSNHDLRGGTHLCRLAWERA